MRAKRICIEKDQAISDDDGDKDQKVVINSLDYDVLAQIIMLLPIPERIDMETVCVEWKEACPRAWYDIKKYKCESSIGRCYDNCLLTQSYLEKILLRCGNYLKELSLSDVCDSSIMPFVGDHCKNLTSLECEFDVNSLNNYHGHFVQAFTQLDKLKCIKITVDFNYSDKTINLSAIIDSLPEEINEIHLFAKRGWNREQSIPMKFKKFKNLQKLTIHHICLDNIHFQEIADIITLVHLSIGIYYIDTNLSLFNKLVNLEYIDLTMGKIELDANILSTKVLETIFCTCKNLKHLDIPWGSYDLAGIPLNKWMNFRNLEYLGIACDMTPDLANIIVEYCKNLKHLRITSDNTIDTALKKLTELKNLECLILDGDYSALEEESIIAISNNCKELKSLEIDRCTIVSSIDGEPLSSPSVLDELSKLQCLEHLNLSFTEILEDSTIIAIANNCKNLKSLEIEHCTGLTETGLVGLSNLKNLEKLDVSYLNKITDRFLIKLRVLKKLDCSYCQELTNAGIIEFINNNPDLEEIYAVGIDNITVDLVIAAEQATKNRTNGIILRLRICNPPARRTFKSNIESQWLVVTS